MLTFAILPILITSLAAAQSSSNPALEIEAIQAHFRGAGIVPELLSSFDPNAVLVANYAGVGDVSPGQALTRAQVAPTPTVSITPVNSSVVLQGNYTLAMVDPGAVGSNLQTVTRHWLVNGVTIVDGKVSNASATAITEYAGPAPPAGSGPHRYVILLYAQPSTFTPPEVLSQPNIGVSTFDLNAYVRDSGLGSLVAGSYYTVEEGTATVSLSATSAVVTSTLPPVPNASGSSTSTSSTGVPASTQSGNAGSNGAVSTKVSHILLALVGAMAFIA